MNHMRGFSKRKQKLFRSLILTLVFCFVFTGMPVYASEGEESSAEIIEERTFEDALEESQGQDSQDQPTKEEKTVKKAALKRSSEEAWNDLADNMSKSSKNVQAKLDPLKSIKEDLEAGRTYIVKSGDKLVLTGDINIEGTDGATVTVEKDGSLTINGVVFKNTKFNIQGDMIIQNGGIKDTTMDSSIVEVDGGKLRMEGGEISGNESKDKTPDNTGDDDYSVVTVKNGGSFEMTGGSVNNNKSYSNGGALRIEGQEGQLAKLKISGGEFKENKAEHPRLYDRGGAIYGNYVDAEISGGTFSKNTTEFGGAMALFNGKLNVSGGTFEGNNNGQYAGKGGAILAYNSDINISGGKFKSNSANGFGGALNIVDSKTEIKGGLFDGNSSIKSGGAISFGGKSESKIYAGKFTNNEASGFWGGGAIYNDTYSKLNLYNTLIRHNTVKDGFMIGTNHPASQQGGGIWNCPTGHSTIYINKGLAIFENSAPDRFDGKYKGSGDDFANIRPHQYNDKDFKDEKNPKISISSRMLGGGERLWYQDGSYYSIHTNLDFEKQYKRFDPTNPGDPIPYDTEIEDQAVFKSNPSESSKRLAEALASVIFEGNSASYMGISGGAITNNGELTFGEPNPYKLQIEKKWYGDNENERPKTITLKLYIGDHYLQDVVLSAENNWKAELKDFPNPETLVDAATGQLLKVNFREESGLKYVLSVEKESQDSEKLVYSFVLANTIPPEEVPVKKEIRVVKLWDDNDDANKLRPKEVTVRLYADGKEIASKVLSADNAWAWTFGNLPKYENSREIVYTVSEDPVEGYESSVNGYNITNKYVPPEKPPENPPENPPEEPPVEPPTPPVQPPKKSNPPTGDIPMEGVILAMALAGLGLYVISRKKKETK